MKIFCALLLIGIIAYVESDPDECAKYAANTKQKPGTEEQDNQVITLDEFISNEETQHFITKATPSEVDGSDDYCTPATHGADCKAIGYWRIILKKPNPGIERADVLEFDAVIVAETGKGYAIKYEMTIKGVKEDSYIFQHKGGKIAAIRIDPDPERIRNVSNDVAPDVLEILQSKFALFYAKDGFSLYVTCNAKTIWVEYDSRLVAEKKTDNTATELDNQIKILRDKITARGLPAPGLIDVTQEMDQVYKNHILKAETPSLDLNQSETED